MLYSIARSSVSSAKDKSTEKYVMFIVCKHTCTCMCAQNLITFYTLNFNNFCLNIVYQ